MSKTITPLAVQLVKFDTSLPFDQVISCLDKETNKAGNRNIVPRIKAAKDQSELEALIHKNIGESGFLYFLETFYHRLLERAEGTAQPKLAVYVIGNPLIAQPILQDNRFAGLNIPLRLVVAEKPERNGTIVAYHLPSSVMTHPDGENNPAIDEKMKLLDEKLEQLVARVTAEGENGPTFEEKMKLLDGKLEQLVVRGTAD